jgi:hypothetical protein
MPGFFVGEIKYTYPHPPLDIRILLVLENAVRKAWEILKDNQPNSFYLDSASEKSVTIALLDIMEELRTTGIVDGFSNKEFETVIREGKLTNFDGQHPDKEPDFVFRLTEVRVGTKKLQDGIITECKPVDKAHPVGSNYCKKGLIRFINGDYAWAMQSGMMIGYVDNAYTIFPKLSDSLKKDKGLYNSKGEPVACPLSEKLNISPMVYKTIHERKWQYPQNGKKAPDITIRHLWLTK